MNIAEIRVLLDNFGNAEQSLDDRFVFDRYHTLRDDREVRLVTHPRYLPPLAKLIQRLRPSTMLTIGALFGTTEAYVLQCCEGRDFLRAITICDLDISDYNSQRDNGSLMYRNICGTTFGAFDNTFTMIRGSSRWAEVKSRIAACGPYDLAFVDGEHTADAVYEDISTAAESLSPGGTILVHDTSLFSSSVPAGWDRWAKDHHPEWVCDAVPDGTFLFGLGFIQRSHSQT